MNHISWRPYEQLRSTTSIGCVTNTNTRSSEIEIINQSPHWHSKNPTMKIGSVEVQNHHNTQQHHSEDCTSSTYSIEEPPVDYELTVASLTQALTELQQELRDRTSENEALLATASSLSNSLQQSDRLLQEKSLECERLALKLQMVTFVERNDESSRSLLDDSHQDFDTFSTDDLTNEETVRSLADLDDDESVSTTRSADSTSLSKKQSKKKKSKNPGRQQEGSSTVNTAKSKPSSVPLPKSSPVSVDDFLDESAPEIGPRQAHFYNVMLERDRALYAAKKLKKELKESKQKVRELKGKLDRSNLLVEISYHHQEQQKKKKERKVQQHQEIVSMVQATNVGPARGSCTNVPLDVPETPPPPKRLLTRKWLRGTGKSVRKNKEDHDTNSSFKTLVTDDEKLPSKWNNTCSRNEAAYLDAIAANDADRAGGHDSVRFQL